MATISPSAAPVTVIVRSEKASDAVFGKSSEADELITRVIGVPLPPLHYRYQ